MYVYFIRMYIFPNKSASFRHFRLGLSRSQISWYNMVYKIYKTGVGKVAKSPSLLILFDLDLSQSGGKIWSWALSIANSCYRIKSQVVFVIT